MSSVDLESAVHSKELCEMAKAHFNEPMLSMDRVVRCIGYGETGADCYIIARLPGGAIHWLTCVGGYTFLNRLAGQRHVTSTSGEEWDDLFRLDRDLALNGCPPEDEFRIELRHDDMERGAISTSPALSRRWEVAEEAAKAHGIEKLIAQPRETMGHFLEIADAIVAERDRLEIKSAQAYQVVGVLLDRCGLFDTDEGIRALDYLANETEVDDDFLPWPRFEKEATADWPTDGSFPKRLARAWATMDGKVEDFDREKGMNPVEHANDPDFTGSYAGYIADAQALLRIAGEMK